MLSLPYSAASTNLPNRITERTQVRSIRHFAPQGSLHGSIMVAMQLGGHHMTKVIEDPLAIDRNL